jgi:proline iminopeptidase
MPHVSVEGANLFYDTVGSGPPLLMMHANGLDHTYLRPWHDALAERATVIYYDMRWNGRSDRKGRADHSRWHTDACALLDHLGEKRATIFGHSYGAWLAQSFAARYPHRVSSLILCGASPAFDHVTEAVAEAQRRDPVAAAALMAAFASPMTQDVMLETIWTQILPLYFHGEVQRELLARTRFSAPGFVYGQRALDGFSMVEALPKLAIPILVLAGKYDFLTPPSQARRIAAIAQNATVVEFDESGHFPYVEETDAYLDAIRRWWR